jgi:cobalt/nickel transport system permease protein
MHIAEGFLPWYWCVFWFAISLPIVAYGFYQIRKIFREHPEQKLTMAVSGAFIFVLSSLKMPSVTGSSSHPTGTAASTLLYGVTITASLSFIVLIFQALLLAHGGITTLGANDFSMGIMGPLVAYLAYRGLMRLKVSLVPTVFIVAFLADICTYITTAVQLALVYPTNGSVMASWVDFMSIYAVTQIPLSIAEAILMVMFFDYLSRARPDITAGKLIIKKKEGEASEPSETSEAVK